MVQFLTRDFKMLQQEQIQNFHASVKQVRSISLFEAASRVQKDCRIYPPNMNTPHEAPREPRTLALKAGHVVQDSVSEWPVAGATVV